MDPRGWRCDKHIDLLQLFNFHLSPTSASFSSSHHMPRFIHLRRAASPRPAFCFPPLALQLSWLRFSRSTACLCRPRTKERINVSYDTFVKFIRQMCCKELKNITFFLDILSATNLWCMTGLWNGLPSLQNLIVSKISAHMTSSKVTLVVCVQLEGQNAVKWSLAPTLYHWQGHCSALSPNMVTVNTLLRLMLWTSDSNFNKWSL